MKTHEEHMIRVEGFLDQINRIYAMIDQLAADYDRHALPFWRSIYTFKGRRASRAYLGSHFERLLSESRVLNLACHIILDQAKAESILNTEVRGIDGLEWVNELERKTHGF